MKRIQKWLALVLCIALLASVAALAEDTIPAETIAAETAAPAASTAVELADDAVVATVNGENITWGSIKANYENLVGNYGSYYDMTQTQNVNLFRSVAMENVITTTVMMQKAKELGLDQLTVEDRDAIYAQADADWDAALQNYITYYYPDMTEESSEEEKAAANTAAVAYYNEAGYTPDTLRAEYIENEIYGRLEGVITQDAVVTDADVEAAYQASVEADKALYENDIAGYIDHENYVDQMAMYAMMYGAASDMEHAWYKPAGFRAVKHILLEVDSELMSSYKALQARLEEQQDTEEVAAEDEAAAAQAAEATAEATDAVPPESTQAPVTQNDVDMAKAAILSSLADKIDEINQKLADGADFDELIATYGVKADGSATDGGMLSEPYKTSGYEVATQSITTYVPEFVEAAFSVDNIGDVSAPYISDYGVHIVKYIGDVAAGPIQMTDAEREAKRTSLLEDKKSELISAQVDEWVKAAAITYSGSIPSIAELEAQQAAEEEVPVEPEQELDTSAE